MWGLLWSGNYGSPIKGKEEEYMQHITIPTKPTQEILCQSSCRWVNRTRMENFCLSIFSKILKDIISVTQDLQMSSRSLCFQRRCSVPRQGCQHRRIISFRDTFGDLLIKSGKQKQLISHSVLLLDLLCPGSNICGDTGDTKNSETYFEVILS